MSHCTSCYHCLANSQTTHFPHGFNLLCVSHAVKSKQQQQMSSEADDTKYVSSQAMRPINFASPDFGRRLAVFEPLNPHVKVMPTRKQNLTEASVFQNVHT